ncbi:MAG: rhomboid family intramembrane serine protease [Planctomycetaceae bacterium]|jgi:membrane associated rhomboid family serine protease|nr:rhomboid family intramembrane serine protease [Planctomycetaceae bacterium]
MGLSDRDYFWDNYNRNQRRRGNNVAKMSVTMRIVIVNFALWLTNGLFFPQNNFLTSILMTPPGVLYDPWRWYTFLTSGFVHSPSDISHILLNMLGLLIFGYGLAFSGGIGGTGSGIVRTDNIEWRLGRGEYFLFYILAIIFASISHAVFSQNAGGLGASGGVVAVVIMYAFLYPNKTILFMFVIPMPMWVLGIILVGTDFIGAMGNSKTGIGYTAHLGGAVFALIYYYLMFKKNLSFTGSFLRIKNRTISNVKTTLKIFNGGKNSTTNDYNSNNLKEAEYTKRLDEILDKYGKVGEAGLTKEEQDFLQEASKKYRNKNMK